MARLEELDRTGLVGSAPEEAFDRITRLAKRLLGADAAFVSLIGDEHQFLKSVTGAAPDLPRQQPARPAAPSAACGELAPKAPAAAR